MERLFIHCRLRVGGSSEMAYHSRRIYFEDRARLFAVSQTVTVCGRGAARFYDSSN